MKSYYLPFHLSILLLLFTITWAHHHPPPIERETATSLALTLIVQDPCLLFVWSFTMFIAQSLQHQEQSKAKSTPLYLWKVITEVKGSTSELGLLLQYGNNSAMCVMERWTHIIMIWIDSDWHWHTGVTNRKSARQENANII